MFRQGQAFSASQRVVLALITTIMVLSVFLTAGQRVAAAAEPRMAASTAASIAMEHTPSPMLNQACNGQTKVQLKWGGFRVFFNSCHTRLLINALASPEGAALSILVATIMGKGIGGIIMAAIVVVVKLVGAVRLADANRNNTGIVIDSTWGYRWSVSSQ